MANAKELAAQAEALRKVGEVSEEGDVIDEEEEPEEEAEPAEKGASEFLSYDEYIKAGKDPDLYKGKKAWEEKQALLQANKDLKKDFRQLSETVTSTMDEWRNTERAKLKTELANEMAQHKADGNIDGVLEVKEKLDAIKVEEKKGLTPQLPPVITDYISENPLIDINSKEFNGDFFEDFKLVYDSEIARLTNGTGKGLSDRQITRALNKAYEEAEDLNKGAKVQTKSPRNDRQGAGRTQNSAGSGKGPSIEVRLKAMKFGDNRNTDLNPHPAYATYMKMKETNSKAAERFAKNILGD